jgi:RNA polymerase sigma-70 factor, ECF subfamily
VVTGRDGEDDSYEEFFTATYPRLVGALVVTLRDRGAAEDAAQDAMAKAFTQWPKVGAMTRPEGWAFVVAVRAARRTLAREERLHRKLADQNQDEGEMTSLDSVPDVDSDLGLLLDRLTPRERMAVVLRFVVDLDLAQIAEAMSCKVGTVKATLHSARSKLEPEVSPK